MSVVESSSEVYVLRRHQIELSFHHMGDRWQHQISVLCEREWRILVSSEEGIDSSGRLVSPALQDLRLEEPGDGVVEFQLLGQAARGVYSAAIRFDGPARSIEFDMCARALKPGAALCTSSRYRAGDRDAFTIEPRPAGGLALIPGHGPGIELLPLAYEGGETECRCLDQGTVQTLVAGSAGRLDERPTRNVRWRYRMRWV
jgi:hypothetical protein